MLEQAALSPPPLIGPRSAETFGRARRVFPDGTTRVTIERDPIPRYMHHGESAFLVDVDGRRLLDLNGNFTTLIHGHAFPPVIKAVTHQLRSGCCFANPTEIEIALAELLCARIPHLDRIRFVNTGTEAVMFAIKAARAFTGRPAIAKIEGAYHGAYDWVEVSQAATPQTWGDPEHPAPTLHYRGMPRAVLDDVVILRFNNAEGARRLITEHAARLAAVLVDPMPSRGGLISPTPDFVSAIQETARRHGILVISDEVLNLRQGYEGASALYGLAPDLFALGKIIGGGLPIGAIGGRSEVMAVFDAASGRPALPQGGTFSANPLSMAAGLAAMEALDRAAFDHLERLGDKLRIGLERIIARHGAPLSVTGAASLFRLHPRRKPPREFRETFLTPREVAVMTELTRFFATEGIVLPNAAAACLSTPMDEDDIALVANVFDRFLNQRASLLDTIKG
ncbi:aspartate aminotransferase family protein [Mesorhizobium sp. IMUNJ 23033]|uniref:aspartate aminotransferase family protein n=1 Tax=Mesorhizobium sp. IMUNJ 23033 TaxID=3378039 RepID=UPI0038508E1E